MCRYKELEERVKAMKKQIEAVPENTPDEIVWGLIEEFDELIVQLGGEFDDDDFSIVKA